MLFTLGLIRDLNLQEKSIPSKTVTVITLLEVGVALILIMDPAGYFF